jgi:hypothetical protein
MLILTALSWYIQPKLNIYSEDEVTFGRQYAGQLLEEMERVAAGARQIDPQEHGHLCDYYLDGEEKFRELKSAATHLKGEQAEDFVYALALAEAWCKQAAEAAYRPANTQAKVQAELRYKQAREELLAIQRKEYKKM